ncbi:hypothetical protein DL95DRAFT_452847 [Leptodontidium sp. 2 PMI_412]|nr:hypothetical protein DL95DRAFT_452847 [Leptodontidium sp. 2 PMI_412]
MAYISQMGVMRQKAEWCKEEGDKEKGDKEEEVTFSKVRTYYRNSLLTIQNALPRMLPERHQYRAEAQTWASFWPEDPFPGIEPVEPPLPRPRSDMTSPTGLPSPISVVPGKRRLSDLAPHLLSMFKTKLLQYQAELEREDAETGFEAPIPATQVEPCGHCNEFGHSFAQCTLNMKKYDSLHHRYIVNLDTSDNYLVLALKRN